MIGGKDMTEKEKMENHMLYDANYDKELEAERIRCKTLCQEYNNLPIQDLDSRRGLLLCKQEKRSLQTKTDDRRKKKSYSGTAPGIRYPISR